MNIQWNAVTRVSQFASIVLFILVFLLGIWLGMEYQKRAYENAVKAALNGTL